MIIRRVADPQDWRSRKRAATRRRIYTTAMRLFRERGYGEVTIGDLSTAAGVSVPTFYAHYRSKEHVVLPALTDEAMVAAFLEQPTGLPLSERIRLSLHQVIDALGPEGCAELLERWQLVIATPALRVRSAEREHDAVTALLAGLHPSTDRQPRGSPLAPLGEAIVVAVCLSAAATAFRTWAATDGDPDLGKMIDAAFRALREMTRGSPPTPIRSGTGGSTR